MAAAHPGAAYLAADIRDDVSSVIVYGSDGAGSLAGIPGVALQVAAVKLSGVQALPFRE
jgi:hypothetical protein